MGEPKRKQTIKEWELETGIKVVDPKGFNNWNGRSRILTNKYSKEQFRRGLYKSTISVKTTKGMKFYKGEDFNIDECWRSYVKFNSEKKYKEDKNAKYRIKKVIA